MAKRVEMWKTADGMYFSEEKEAAKHESVNLRRDALAANVGAEVADCLLGNRDLALELVGILVHVHTFANNEISEEIQDAKSRIA